MSAIIVLYFLAQIIVIIRGSDFCPLDVCSFLEWETWSACSVSCGGGLRTRTRPLCCLPWDSYDQCVSNCNVNRNDARETGSCSENCLNGGIYTNRCICPKGVVGSCCQEDIDECSTGANTCDINATCTNTFGSFSCTCKSGFSGSGVSCTDVNECLETNNCHDNADCTNTIGSYTCVCKSGFSSDGVSTCTDIDECGLGTDTCPGNQTCSNNAGSYACVCSPGFDKFDATCKDVDECSRGTDNCHRDADCTNTEGSFVCTCPRAFTGNGIFCKDIDECSTGAVNCHEEAECINTDGSFTCTCKAGYYGDGQYCEGINECSIGLHDCHENARCINTKDSFNCTCRDGYTGDGESCDDVDECADQLDNCHGNAKCINTDGSFECNVIEAAQVTEVDLTKVTIAAIAAGVVIVVTVVIVITVVIMRRKTISRKHGDGNNRNFPTTDNHVYEGTDNDAYDTIDFMTITGSQSEGKRDTVVYHVIGDESTTGYLTPTPDVVPGDPVHDDFGLNQETIDETRNNADESNTGTSDSVADDYITATYCERPFTGDNPATPDDGC